MPVYHIERGGHADMHPRLPHALLRLPRLGAGPWNSNASAPCCAGRSCWLLKDQQNAECGYALMLKNRLSGYVLLGWLSVYPHIRGGGIGGEFLRLIREYYERWEGIPARGHGVSRAGEGAEAQRLLQAQRLRRRELPRTSSAAGRLSSCTCPSPARGTLRLS